MKRIGSGSLVCGLMEATGMELHCGMLADRLLERPEKQKMLFVISDGAPNANQYGGTSKGPSEDSEKAAAAGVFFQAAAIGSDKGNNSGNL